MGATREFDERVRSLLDVSSDAVFLAATDGSILHANPAACRMFGRKADEFAALSTSDFSPDPEALARFSAERKRRGAIRAGVPLLRKGGERFEAEVTSAEFRLEGGESRVWVVVHDLSERRRADDASRALQESEATFRALSEASFEGIFLHRDGRILQTNSAMDRMYRAKPGELIGRRLLDFVAPSDHALVMRKVAERNEEPYEGLALRMDGTTFPTEVQARTGPVSFRGEPTRVVAIRDVSVRKELEARLAVADRMAALGTLAAGVGHEINNPLSVVMLSLELAQKELRRGPDAVTARVEELLANAAESAERVQRIVRDLRALARPLDEPAAEIDLAEVIAYAENLANYQLRQRARVEVRIAPFGPVYGSRARLEQIIVNLLVNAAHAIPDDGGDHRIDIDVHEAGPDRFAIEVRDTGIGMTPELQARIFDPFVTTKAIGEGTGLGLSICHTVVTALGGTIDVESEVGKGSRFRVELPRGNAPTAADDRVAVPSASKRARVLIIDDEKHIRDMLVQLLEGHDAVAETGAPAALARLERGEVFDVILCDLMMPGMSGADFYDEVERRWPALLDRIIIVSGGAVTPRSQALLERVASPPLEKPFPPAVLEARIAAMLR
jgi:two-component system cell cycle sensor histidine kinase/response regulator CckA